MMMQGRLINQPIIKIDAPALTAGKPLYTDDLAPGDTLVVKLLRSPYAYAKILQVDKSKALSLPGVEAVFTYEDDFGNRYTSAGQTYPEPSPYDRKVLDRYVRYIGDVVAIIAACDEKTAQQALKAVKVDYQILEPLLDYEKAVDNRVIVHDEEDYHLNFPIGNQVKRNICASGSYGDREASEDIYQKCPLQIDEIYYTKAQSQTAMENFVSYTYLDHRGRLVIYSSTQIIFHVRRIIARALNIPSSMIRVIKPKVGGGFGAKQTAVSEFYPAFVTWKTGKAAKIVYDRQESFIASNSRHAMRVHVRLGADREGKIKTILLDALSNTGAYGEHGSTTVGLTGGKSLAVYQTEATCFNYQVVYTNTMPAAAFRGYGNPQGCFAVESAVNQLADLLAMDPLELRIKNVVRTGDFMPAYDNRGEKLLSGSFLACLEKGADIFHWKEKFAQNKCQDFISAGKRRGVGLALCMQSSGIADIDTASAWIRLNDDGFYTLSIGAADMGTGCDTILPQIAGEVLQCPLERIIISSIDTDSSPFDSGSYASSTTYVTGRAVFDAAEKLREKIIAKGGLLLDLPKEDLAFDGDAVYSLKHDKKLSLNEIACQMTMGRGEMLQAQATYGSSVSPPPLMAGFVEIEVDTETGLVKVIDMLGIVDCGTVINSNLARIQAEGGLVQGLGFALMEDVFYTDKGKMITDSFMQYKIPSRLDIGKIRVDFVDSFEPTGPYGAKSIGEVVINTPPPAISAALHQGAGIYLRELPIRSDKVLKKIKNQK